MCVFGNHHKIKEEIDKIDYKEDNLLMNKNKIMNLNDNINDMNNEKTKSKKINEFKK